MSSSTPTFLFVLCLLGACDTASCPEGSIPDTGRCITANHVGMDGGNRDGGDAERDSGRPDAGRDAGPCGMACTGDTPHCDEASRSCVECLERSQCTTTALPACVDGACEECGANTDCSTAAASRCEANSCVACAGDGDCSHVAGLNVCVDGACVACRTGSNCASGVCLLSTNTCAPTGGTGTRCSECVRDDECQAGMLCVPMRFGATSVGNFCAWRRDATGTGAPAGNCFNSPPYVRDVTATSIDGVATSVCVLRTSTCEAHEDFSRKACTMPGMADSDCGAPSVNDGFCAPGSRCTVECTTYEDCPCIGPSCTRQYDCIADTCSLSRRCDRTVMPVVCED